MAKKVKLTDQVKKSYSKFMRKWGKFVPLVAIILLIAIGVGKDSSQLSDSQPIDFKTKIVNTWNALTQSFYVGNAEHVLITVLLIVAIWTGYKYWLTRIKAVRKNSDLLEKLVMAIIFIIIVNNHVRTGTVIGDIVDWLLFLTFLYLVIAGSWFLAKTIDQIDLSSDLYCWGLRLVGAVTIFFGIILLTSSSLALSLSNTQLVFDNIYWIASICIILLGAFMGYRSTRRGPAIHVW